MAHGGEFEFPHYYFVAAVEPKGVRDGVDSRGGARDHRHFLPFGVNELGKDCADLLVLFEPFVPGCGRFAPTPRILSHSGLYFIGKRTLRAAIKISLVAKNGEVYT